VTDNLDTTVASFCRAFEPVLESLLSPCPDFIKAPLAYGCLGGGKRLRPFLTAQVGGCYDAPAGALLRVGAAIELIHGYSLIHDDLPAMDNALLRRGKPSAHVAFGEAQAILLGDGLLTRAFEVLSHEADLTAEVRLQLIQHLGQASGIEGMVAGQWLDMAPEHQPLSQNELVQRHQLKTGALMACSCRMGAIVGGADLAAQDLWRAYGLTLGLAFQVADDVLDASGMSQDMGKGVGQDGSKTTFLTLLGPEGAKAYSAACVEEAHDLLSQIPTDNGQNINTLHRLTDYIITRTR
jgi:farnesyl diphosphate synthase